ncbi:MAG: F0F1 ATP synthase subunit B [Terriglobia bacterium]
MSCNKYLKTLRILLVSAAFFCLLLTPTVTRAEETHQGSSAGGHEKSHEESPWASVFRWANFLILFGGLGYYLRKPMREFFESRSRSIEEGLKNARHAKDEALRKIREIESRMAQLDQEIQALKEQALREADEEKARIVEGAKLEAAKILEMAKREIEGLKKLAHQELKGHVAELAVALAEERLKKTVGAEENKKIVNEFIENLQPTKN